LWTTHSDVSGIALVTGSNLDAKLLCCGGGDWAQKFAAAARQNQWKAEMVWYRMTP
jgi:hypothetical protein